MLRFTMFSAAACLTLTQAAAAQIHRDVNLLIEDGKLVTGAVNFDLPGDPVEPGARVFSATLGEGIAHFTDDPGFNAPGGTFDSGTNVGFDILDALWKYNETTQRFDIVPAETLFVGLSVLSRTTPTTPATTVTGFNFAAIGGSGGMHQHINFFLNAPQGDGIYLYISRITSDDASIEHTDPIYVLFNESLDPVVLDEAIQVVEANIVDPQCPGDTNSDGRVDFADLNTLLANWDRDVPVGTDADVTLDGRVDFADLNEVLGNWDSTCS